MTKILLTGGQWGDREGTTVEVSETWPGNGGPHTSVDGVTVCLGACSFSPGFRGVEVPYLIGETVRLTGDKWLDPGTIREISGYWYSSAGKAWLPTLDTGDLVSGDWTVEPVATGGYTGTGGGLRGKVHEAEFYFIPEVKDPNNVTEEEIATGIKLDGITDISIPGVWDLKFIEHPNFVQVSVKVPTFSSEYDKSYSAYREDEYSPWEILSTEIEDATDIKGLRRVLDEIERRMEKES